MPLTHPADAVTAVNPSSHTGVHVSPCARGTTQSLSVPSSHVRRRRGTTQSLSVPFRGGVETCAHEEGSASWNTCADPLLDPLSSSRRPDHHRAAVDRDAVAELVTRSAVASVSLATCVQPEARSLAVARVNT